LEQLVFLNGSLSPRSQAVISPFDHGFLYGFGLFETVRAYSGILFRLDRHIARLFRGAAIIGLSSNLTAGQLQEACYHVLRGNSLQDARLRITMSAGEGEATPQPPDSAPTTFITAGQYIPDQALHVGGARAVFSALRRSNRSLPARLKTTSYLDNLIARREARAKGADEALFLNEQGRLCEGSTSNIFVVSGETLITPSLHSGTLAGITREAVIEVARAENLEVAEKEVSPEELAAADEAFLTSSLIELLPLVEVEGKPIGAGRPGPLTQRLSEAYAALVKAEMDRAASTQE
jgi:branched-chain amino acid aminotransferase